MRAALSAVTANRAHALASSRNRRPCVILRAHSVRQNSSNWKEQLTNALEGVKSGGKFAVTGKVDGPLPDVAVRGVGKLALPISTVQALALTLSGAPAPFGKGSATVLDPAVRRAIQIEADRVEISSGWKATLQHLVTDTAAALGLPGGGVGAGVEARLYKLLVYERGGHFKAHRDTEKEPGMFGTLLVQLPVAGGHTGGRLTIRHQGQEVAWDTAAAAVGAAGASAGATAKGKAGSSRGGGSAQQSPALHYAAFYADCEHELSEVESGLRVVLAYNLVRVGQQAAAQGGGTDAAALTAAPAGEVTDPVAAAGFHSSAGEDSAVTAAVRAWEAAGAAAQPLVTIPLAHKYTAANLGFGALKGTDAVKVQALLDCPLLDVHLVLFEKEIENRGFDCDEHETPAEANAAVGEDEDYSIKVRSSDQGQIGVEAWHSPLFGLLNKFTYNYYYDREGTGDPRWPVGWRKLADSSLAGGELFPRGLMPDERYYKPYTGNEGPRANYFYRRAMVVAWPRSRRLQLTTAPESVDDAVELARQRLARLRPMGAAGGDGTSGSVGAASPGAAAACAAGSITLQQYLLLQLEERQPRELAAADQQAEARQAVELVLHCAAKEAADGTLSGMQLQQALELLCSEQAAQLCGELWAEQACVLVAESMARADKPYKMKDSISLPAAFASTAAALQSDSFNSAVVELVARQAPRQLQGCYQLVTLKALPAALRERVARAFRTAVFGPVAVAVAGAAAAGGGAAPSALSPSSKCLAQLPEEDMRFLAGLVFAAEGADATPCSGMAGAFAAAVLRRPDCQQSLLPALLKEPAVRGALAARPPMPAAVQLAQARIAYLEPRVLPGVPKDDFSVPDAICKNLKVTAFLRSPEQETVFTDFHGMAQALDWATDIVSYDERQSREFQAITVARIQGGKGASVRVTKNPDKNNQRIALYHSEAAELAELRALMTA